MGIRPSKPVGNNKKRYSKTKQNTTPLNVSPLSLLPTELILQIASFLPRDAIAALALSCQSLRLALPNSRFRLPWEDKLNLLILLEQDLPGHTVCRYCRKLHAIEKADLYLPTRLMRAPYSKCCWEQMYTLITDRVFHRRFSIIVFEMAVKQDRLGRDISKLLGLLSYEARTDQMDGHIERHSVLARVIDGCLMIREQRVCFMPCSHQEPLPRNARFNICPHFTLSIQTFERLSGMASRFDRSDLPDMEACPPGPDLIPCRHCHTEFRIDFRSFGDSGTGVSIITWKDLGESLLGDKWRSLIGNDVDMVTFDQGSIGTAFEGEDYRLFKPDWSLEPQLRKKLLKQKSAARKNSR
ncbi:hypothetical protein IFR04_008190 [Cadophora malorum]|uniref:F-box domain-containing protein n=1 Tax=Cadophora malorum TaxID=108018 RepID=A0A8H7TBQ9_9HELO|nr:hypothetical protein IFR04_008190 [Cadophora malorum]